MSSLNWLWLDHSICPRRMFGVTLTTSLFPELAFSVKVIDLNQLTTPQLTTPLLRSNGVVMKSKWFYSKSANFVILMQGMHWFGVIAAGFSISLNYSAVCYGISASSFAASS